VGFPNLEGAISDKIGLVRMFIEDALIRRRGFAPLFQLEVAICDAQFGFSDILAGWILFK
jgi:hypothetical protein